MITSLCKHKNAQLKWSDSDCLADFVSYKML